MTGYDDEDGPNPYAPYDPYDEADEDTAEREHRRAFRQLLDARELMDPAAQRVLDVSLAMNAVAELRGMRAYLLDEIAGLREHGFGQAEPNAGVLASIDTGIARWLAIAEGDYQAGE
jgi:hypothetical protein